MNESKAGQNFLKNRLTEITDLVPTDRPVVYLDYPVHGNFGDLLIFLGTLGFLSDYGYSIETCKSLHWLPKRVSPDAVVLMHGGGNFGDLYPQHQNYREAAIMRFQTNRIVILPQTIHFQQEAALQRAREVIQSHPDLHLLLRDSKSFEIAKQSFPGCNSRLLPDMSHHIWPVPSFRTGPVKKNGKPIFLIRNDKEAGRTFPELDRHAAHFRDWAAFYTGWESRQIRRWKFMHRVNAKLYGALPLIVPWRHFCSRLFSHLSQEFSNHGPMVTSRVHGAIFGTLLGKKVGLLDNSYGKNRRYFDTWAEDLAGVEFIDSPDRLRGFLK